MNNFLQQGFANPVQPWFWKNAQRRDRWVQTLDKAPQAFIEGLAQPGETRPDTPEAWRASK
jgi:hypothetical protein